MAMGEIKTKVGNPIRLDLQLADLAEDQYVQAILLDEAGAAFAIQALPHISQGLYSDDTQIMPNKPQITATFVVYSDAGFTTRNENYTASFETYMRDDNATQLDIINNKLNAISAGTGPGDLTGVIVDGGILAASIKDSGDFTGVLDDQGHLVGIIEDEELTGILIDNGALEGTIKDCGV